MRVFGGILVLLAAPGIGTARADLALFNSAASHLDTPARASGRYQSSAGLALADSLAPATYASRTSDPISWALSHHLPDGNTDAQARQNEVQVIQLPEGPGGLALGVSVLASIGAFHACRSFRKLHSSGVPDWYHTNAGQIGHATPFDLTCGATMAICLFDEPAARPSFTYRIPREPCSRLRSHFLLLIESPRGPPSSA